MRNCAKAGKSPTTLPNARQVSELGDGGATSPAVTAMNGERVRDDAGRPQSLVEIALVETPTSETLSDLSRAGDETSYIQILVWPAGLHILNHVVYTTLHTTLAQ